MSRPQGSRNRLVSLTYDTIAEMAGGITGDTARRYAQRGEYDARSLASVMEWINMRRAARGWPLIGLPDSGVVSETANDTPLASSLSDPWSQFLRGLPVFIPPLGQYRSIYDM